MAVAPILIIAAVFALLAYFYVTKKQGKSSRVTPEIEAAAKAHFGEANVTTSTYDRLVAYTPAPSSTARSPATPPTAGTATSVHVAREMHELRVVAAAKSTRLEKDAPLTPVSKSLAPR